MHIVKQFNWRKEPEEYDENLNYTYFKKYMIK